MNHNKSFLKDINEIVNRIDIHILDEITENLLRLRNAFGRLFILGVGGSAGNASHAVNDFRKLCGIEAYAPTDNVSELTARTNDDGWETVFTEWLKVSKMSDRDALLVFSVGGGNIEKNVSVNLVKALDYAIQKNTPILGIVGRDGGYLKKVGSAVLVIPTANPEQVTPHSEAFQAIIWHCLVSNPSLQINNTKW
jgi:D-sedoheptulose 7-phosphate isomerase